MHICFMLISLESKQNTAKAMNKDKDNSKDRGKNKDKGTNNQEKVSNANTEGGFSARLLAAKKRAADKEDKP